MSICIREEPISYYVDRLRGGVHFALAGYSDAEWYCILKHDLGKATGLGQILHGPTGDRLLEVLKARQGDSDFLFAVPKVLWTLRDCVKVGIGPRIEALLRDYQIKIAFYERDMVTDSLASTSGLFPLISQLQQMNTVVIGPRELRGLDFLGNNYFVEIGSPNLHLQTNGIEHAVSDALQYDADVYLVSAGVSAALIIDQLYDQAPTRFFMDCGSIWDAFVGLGGQRAWRGRLFSDRTKLEQWRHDNLYGKDKS